MSLWDIFIQLLPVLAGIGGTAALLSWRQNHHASLRTAWWGRMRWAVEQANSSTDHQQIMGLKILHTISASGMTPKWDMDIFDDVYAWATERHEILHSDRPQGIEDNQKQEGVTSDGQDT